MQCRCYDSFTGEAYTRATRPNSSVQIDQKCQWDVSSTPAELNGEQKENIQVARCAQRAQKESGDCDQLEKSVSLHLQSVVI